MANRKIIFDIIAKNREALNSIKEMERMGEKTAQSIGNAFKVAGAMAGAAFVGAAKIGLQYNAQMEQFQTGLTTLLGSEAEAVKLMEQIKKDAAATPFDVSTLVQANQMMISTGLSAEESKKSIFALGNALSASGQMSTDTFMRMIANLQQVKNQGVASAMDIKQFAMAGIDIYGLLADYLGMTTAEVKNQKITWDMLNGALVYASEEGGKYFNAMNAQALTFNGRLETLKDTISNKLGDLFKPLFESASEWLGKIAEFIENLDTQKIIDGFSKFLNILKILGVIIVPLMAAFITFRGILAALFIVNSLSTAFAIFSEILMLNPFMIVAMAVAAFVAALIYLWTTCEGFRNVVAAVFNYVKSIIVGTFNAVCLAVQTVVNLFTETIPALIAKIGEFFTAIWNYVKTKLPQIIAMFISFWSTLPGKLWTVLLQALGKLGSFVTQMGGKALAAASGFVKNLLSGLKGLPSKVLSIGGNIVKGLWNGIKGGWSWLTNQTKTLCNNLLKSVKSALKIHSPSKVFADEVGKFIPEGIGVGIKRGTSTAIDSIKNMGRGIIQAGLGLNLESTISHDVAFKPVPSIAMEDLNVNLNSTSMEDTVNVVLNLDGKTIANSVNKVNRQLSLQYGGYASDSSKWY